MHLLPDRHFFVDLRRGIPGRSVLPSGLPGLPNVSSFSSPRLLLPLHHPAFFHLVVPSLQYHVSSEHRLQILLVSETLYHLDQQPLFVLFIL
jgi:hypothetical protein